MVAIMKYECGLKFTGYVFEDEETAKEWLKYKAPWAYEIVPVTFFAKNGEVK